MTVPIDYRNNVSLHQYRSVPHTHSGTVKLDSRTLDILWETWFNGGQSLIVHSSSSESVFVFTSACRLLWISDKSNRRRAKHANIVLWKCTLFTVDFNKKHPCLNLPICIVFSNSPQNLFLYFLDVSFNCVKGCFQLALRCTRMQNPPRCISLKPFWLSPLH